MSAATATTITLNGTAAEKAIAKAIGEFHAATNEAKKQEVQAGIAKTKIKAFAEARWLKLWEGDGVLPAAPFKILAPDGLSVSYVVQDRSDGYEIKPELSAELKSMLNGDTQSVVEKSIDFGFDSKVLHEPSATDRNMPVGAIVAGRLGSLLATMVAIGDITQDQADRLFTARQIEILKPSLLGRLPQLAARAGVELKELLGVIGSAVVRFIR